MDMPGWNEPSHFFTAGPSANGRTLPELDARWTKVVHVLHELGNGVIGVLTVFHLPEGEAQDEIRTLAF